MATWQVTSFMNHQNNPGQVPVRQYFLKIRQQKWAHSTHCWARSPLHRELPVRFFLRFLQTWGLILLFYLNCGEEEIPNEMLPLDCLKNYVFRGWVFFFFGLTFYHRYFQTYSKVQRIWKWTSSYPSLSFDNYQYLDILPRIYSEDKRIYSPSELIQKFLNFTIIIIMTSGFYFSCLICDCLLVCIVLALWLSTGVILHPRGH